MIDLLVAGSTVLNTTSPVGDAVASGRRRSASPSNVVAVGQHQQRLADARIIVLAHRWASPSIDDGLAAQDRVADPAGELAPGVRRVAAAAGQRGRVDHPRVAPGRSRRGWRVARRRSGRRGCVVEAGDARPAATTAAPSTCGERRARRLDQLGERERERGLEAEHARAAPRRTARSLVSGRVRRVVGGDGVDGAVGQAGLAPRRRRRRCAAAGSP